MPSETQSSFEREELELLSTHFRLTKHASLDRALSLPSIELTNPEVCKTYLKQAADVFQTTNLAAAASQFSKRYAYLTMSAGLYAMTMYDKGLDYSIENCHMESVYRDGSWLPEVRLVDWSVTKPTSENRERWRDRIVRSIYADNIAKVWRSMSEAAKIPIAILWENMAISVYWLYEKRMVEGATALQKERILEDYSYLVRHAPAELFGEKENPLIKFDSPKIITSSSELPIRKRKTCCLLYKIPGRNDDYCMTCPLVKDDLARKGAN